MFKTQIHSLLFAFQNIIAYAGRSFMNPSSRQSFNNFLLDKIQCWTSSCVWCLSFGFLARWWEWKYLVRTGSPPSFQALCPKHFTFSTTGSAPFSWRSWSIEKSSNFSKVTLRVKGQSGDSNTGDVASYLSQHCLLLGP